LANDENESPGSLVRVLERGPKNVCPDAVKQEQRVITSLLATHIGEAFHLRGFTGMPKTGFYRTLASAMFPRSNGYCSIILAPYDSSATTLGNSESKLNLERNRPTLELVLERPLAVSITAAQAAFRRPE
jgi:hypothetical protein